MFKRLNLLFIAGVIAMGAGVNKCQADTIQQQLQKHLPKVIDYLNEHNLKTVGVLKFRVKKPNQRTSDSVGPINSLLADRLEVGLILANPFDEAKQLNVIKDGSRQVGEIKGANHLTEEGRAICFKHKYEIAWGEQQLEPDAFVTGVVQVHDDNEHISVGILCFTKDGKSLEPACEVFQAELDADTLSELGDSFVLRAGIDASLIKGLAQDLLDANKKQNPSAPTRDPNQLTSKEVHQVKQKAATKKAADVKKQSAPFPLSDPNAPLNLYAMYDGTAVQVEVREGRAYLPEPREGQRVEFIMRRSKTVARRLGVVLKVNGENTLFRQTSRDIDCTKWLLSGEIPQVTVRGFQVKDSHTMEQFAVLSRDDSAKRAMDYGRHVGQIHLAVFQEMEQPSTKSQPSKLDLVDDEDEDMLAMMRGMHPPKKPDNLGALKQQIRRPHGNELATRGLIVQGEEKKHAVRKVAMKSDPTPIMAVTITYYKP